MESGHTDASPRGSLSQPQAPFAQPSRPPSSNNSALLLNTGDDTAADTASPKGNKRRNLGLGALALLVIVVLAVVLPVYFLVIKKHNVKSAAVASSTGSAPTEGSTDGKDDGAKGVVSAVQTGGDGSTVTKADGSTFVYQNQFGGYWASSSSDPFLTASRANSWTPPLNQSWDWGKDKIYGVNLGGWFVLEPFIAPALFQAYPDTVDEWTLSEAMRADGTLETVMEKHYNEFITEEDIAQIAGAGLNWIRVPIPFWAVSTWNDVGKDAQGKTVSEPYLEGASWKYIVRLLGWARKYGLRVNLDLHTAPGSQNGYNHSGKLGSINFLNGPMGIANAQRLLDYIRIITEFISQPEYSDVVPMFGILNEAVLRTIGQDQLTSFYLEAHNMIRGITGVGAGKGPYIGIHDGFIGVGSWKGFLPGADRVVLDTHPYFAFNGGANNDPIEQWPARACNAWGPSIARSQKDFGVTVAGEFSNGYNDCGLFLLGTNGARSTHYGGNCADWEDSAPWSAATKAGLKAFSLASMDAMQNWFFWTWKIGAAKDGVVRSPLWSYKLGLERGWMPTDPRDSEGKCAAVGAPVSPSFNGAFAPWQTGGAGAGTIAADALAQFGQWPPATIAGVDSGSVKLLPTYTATGAIPTLTYATVAGGSATPSASPDGWFDDGDKTPAATAVAGCPYPDAYDAATMQVQLEVCTGP
ncbi:glycoside hydrolase [Mycena rebaudengoi]|nr:glycoside hydrolase [Mycena rebaudengoi]